MTSRAIKLNQIQIPEYIGHQSMIPFDLKTLVGLPTEFVDVVKNMLCNVKAIGTAYFTIHGRF